MSPPAFSGRNKTQERKEMVKSRASHTNQLRR